MNDCFKLALLSTTSLALLGSMQPLLAQQASQAEKQSGTLEEIIVTAQRREQRSQDVGVAITAVTAEELALSGTRTTTDLVQLTPSMSVSGAVAGQTLQYSIRGVTQSDYFDGIEPPVAVYIDDIYVPSMQAQSLSIFDVQRVEVLKGPQGTLFGRNATGGLVNTITTKPNTAKVEGYADVSYASHDQATFEGAVNVPMGSVAAVRLSGFYDRLGDYWKNVGAKIIDPSVPINFGSPGVGISNPGLDMGGYENKSGRIQFLLEPSDRLAIRLSGAITDLDLSGGAWFPVPTAPVYDSQGRLTDTVRIGPTDTRLAIGPNGVPISDPAFIGGFLFASPSAVTGQRIFPGGTWYGLPRMDPQDLNIAADYAPHNHRQSWIVGAYVDYDFTNGVHFTSVTGFQRHKGEFDIDVDAHPVNILAYGSRGDVKPFTQEFRLNGKSQGFRWLTGLFYLQNTAHVTNGIIGPKGSLYASLFPGFADTGIDAPTVTSLDTHSTSVFGQIEWDFAPKTTLVAGARYINEGQEYNYFSYFAKNTNDFRINDEEFLFQAQPSFHDKRTENLWAGKLQIEYRPTSEWLLYFGINRGTKAGSYNAKIADGSPPLPPESIPYKPEVLWNYEPGFKYTSSRWLFNANAFYYDYRDYQAFLFTNLIGRTSNVDSKDYGFEAETSILLTNDLTFNLSASYLSTKIKNYEVVPGIFRDVQHTFAPKDKVQANFQYHLPWEVVGGRFLLFAQVAYTSSQYSVLRNFDSTLLPSFTICNFAVSWEGKSGLKLTAFANNAFDKRYTITAFDNTFIAGNNEEVYGKPASYGLTVGYKF